MNPRLKTILLIIAAAIVVGGIAAAVYVFVLQPEATPTNTNTANTNAVNGVNPNTDSGLPNVNGGTTVNTNTDTTTNDNTNTTVATDDQSSILRLARIFVERYGTFSNRNNFENITNLEPLMTEKFQKESAQYISENQNSGIAAEYYGITTTVASSSVEEFNEKNSAVVRLSTRRVESKGDQDPTVYNQDALVKFQYVGDHWKVHAVDWQ